MTTTTRLLVALLFTSTFCYAFSKNKNRTSRLSVRFAGFEMVSSSSSSTSATAAATIARLVLTHSTHVPGLIKLLKRVCQSPGPISTIVPARLHKASSSSQTLELRVCVSPSLEAEKAVEKVSSTTASPVVSSGASHRVLARKGQQVQEVFFVLGSATAKKRPDYHQFADYLRGVLKGEDCTVTVFPKDAASNNDGDEDDLLAEEARQGCVRRGTKKDTLKRIKWF